MGTRAVPWLLFVAHFCCPLLTVPPAEGGAATSPHFEILAGLLQYIMGGRFGKRVTPS